MTRRELITKTARETRYSYNESSIILRSALDIIVDSLKHDEKVVLTGFGTFQMHWRQERKGRNPATGEDIILKARKAVHFTVGKTLKKKLKKK